MPSDDSADKVTKAAENAEDAVYAEADVEAWLDDDESTHEQVEDWLAA